MQEFRIKGSDTIYRFPDGMTDEQIAAVFREKVLPTLAGGEGVPVGGASTPAPAPEPPLSIPGEMGTPERAGLVPRAGVPRGTPVSPPPAPAADLEAPSYMQRILGGVTPGMGAEDFADQATAGLGPQIGEGLRAGLGASPGIGPMAALTPAQRAAFIASGGNEMLLGLPKAILEAAYGPGAYPQPRGTDEQIAAGAGALAGFIVGPGKVAKIEKELITRIPTAARLLERLAPKAGDKLAVAWAKAVAQQAGHLGAAIQAAHTGDILAENSLREAVTEAAKFRAQGAVMGAVFGGVGSAIPGGSTIQTMARVAVVNASLDAISGNRPWDERDVAQKVFDYGVNTYFGFKGAPLPGVEAPPGAPRKVKAKFRTVPDSGEPAAEAAVSRETPLLPPPRSAAEAPARPAEPVEAPPAATKPAQPKNAPQAPAEAPAEPEVDGLSILPRPVDKLHPSPTPPAGDRWTADRGAIPGEPMMVLDETPEGEGKAAITEHANQAGDLLYGVTDAEGNRIGKGIYATVKEAAQAAEAVFPPDVLPSPKTGDATKGKLVPVRDDAGNVRWTAQPMVTEPQTAATLEAGEPNVQEPAAAEPRPLSGVPAPGDRGVVRGRGQLAGRPEEAGVDATQAGREGRDRGLRGGVRGTEPGVGAGPAADDRGAERGGGRAGGPAETLPRPGSDRVVGEQGRDLAGEAEPREVPTGLDLRQAPEIELPPRKRREINDQAREILKKDPADITPDDREILRQYTGKGGLQEADRGTLWQHWTSYKVSRFMWDKLARMGLDVRGKRVLEPAAGVGNIIGNAPEGIRAWDAVEIDPTPAKILSLLYPQAKVHQMGFEDFKARDAFDLVIGNPPFSQTRGAGRVKDRPEIKELHDYFFAAGLDKLKPNGTLAFITGTGTLDKLSPKNRRILHEQAELIVAYRLPNTSFKKNAGTSVTTDLIFMRKRAPGEPVPETAEWLSAKREPHEKGEFNLNDYYRAHPENVLGEWDPGRGIAQTQAGVKGELTDELLQRVLDDGATIKPYQTERAPAAAPVSELTTEQGLAMIDAAEGRGPEPGARPAKAKATAEPSPEGEAPAYRQQLRRGSIFEEGGKLWRNGPEGAVETVEADKKMVKKATDALDLADKLTAIVDAQRAGSDGIAEQEAFAKAARAYQKRHGKTPQADAGLMTTLAGEPRFSRVQATFTQGGALPKIATEKTVHSSTFQIREPDPTDTADVARYSYQRTGKLDMDLMAEITKLPREEVERDLLETGQFFRDGEKVERRVDYLSGDIYAKIDRAREAGLDDQVKALQAVMIPALPTDKTDLSVRYSWVGDDIVAEFARERYGLEVTRNEVGDWDVRVDSQNYWKSSTFIGQDRFRITAKDAFERYLAKRVQRYKSSKNLPPKEAAAKSKELAVVDREFKRWLLTEKPEVAEQLTDTFNRTFRSFVRKDYAQLGRELTFSGLSREFKGKPLKIGDHQTEWVAWALDEGKAVNAHDVGGGKTLAAILLGRALKDRGRAKKPLYVVPSKVVHKWERETRELFPGAEVINLGQLPKGTRYRRLQEVVTSNADFVFISHEGYKEIPLSPEREAQIVGAEIEELAERLRGIKFYKKGKETTETERAIQQSMEKLREKIAMLKDFDRTDQVFFEELGVDAVIVDEAHAYKNLPTDSDARELGIGTGKPSQRAIDMLHKLSVIRDANDGRNVFFLTATPTPNSQLEIYLMLKHIAPEAWTSIGINSPADFVSQFGVRGTKEQYTVEGGVAEKEFLYGYKNANELRAIAGRYIDKRTAEELGVKRPESRIEMTLLDRTPEQQQGAAELIERAAAVRSRAVDPSEDSMLKISTHARQMAASMSIYPPNPLEGYDHKNHKVQVVAKKVASLYDRKRVNGQLVFMDLFGQTTLTENLHTRLKREMVEHGIPEHEIAIINGVENNTPLKKQKVSDAYNAGKLRVVIGTTASMGEGMDLQAITTGIHEVDIPWNPDTRAQRWGRGVRQGNENDLVTIYPYLQKGTFDSYMYQLLGKKQLWKDQMWKWDAADDGRIVKNAAEGIDSADYYDLATELAASPKQQEFFRGQKEARAVTGNARSQLQELAIAEKRIADLEEQVRAREQKIEEAEQRIAEKLAEDPEAKPSRRVIEQHQTAIEAMRAELEGGERGGLYRRKAELDVAIVEAAKTYNETKLRALQAEDDYLRAEGKDLFDRADGVKTEIEEEWHDFRDEIEASGAKMEWRRIQDFIEPTLQAWRTYEKTGRWVAERKEDPTDFTAAAPGREGFMNMGGRPPGVGRRTPWLTMKRTKVSNQKVEDFFQETGRAVPVGQSVKSVFEKLRAGLRERFVYLGDLDKTRFALARDTIRTMQDEVRMATDRAIADVERVVTGDATVGGLTPEGLEILRKKIVLEDLLWDARQGKKTSRDMTEAELKQALIEVNRVFANVPTVQEAYQRRQELWEGVTQDLVDRGVISEEAAERPTYIRHYVLEHMAPGGGGSPRKLTEPFRGHAKQRKGTEKDISTDLIEVEVRALQEIYRANAIEDAANAIAGEYAVKLKKGQKLPDGYAEWRYKRGNLLFQATSIPDAKLAELMQTAVQDPQLGAILQVPETDLHQVLAMGGKRKPFIIPQELAARLDNLPVNEQKSTVVNFSRAVNQGWKRWILRTNPIRYNVRNAAGDGESVNAGDYLPAFKRVPNVVKRLIANDPNDANLAEWRRLGVAGSGRFGLYELGDAKRHPAFERFAKVETLADYLRVVKDLAGRPAEYIDRVSSAREDLLRMAVAEEALVRVDAFLSGKAKHLKHLLGTQSEIEALARADRYRAAAKISRETLGDYGKFTPWENDRLRNGWAPFYSWIKINTHRWPKALVESARQGGAGRTAGAAAVHGALGLAGWAARIFAAYGLIALYNRRDEKSRAVEEAQPWYVRTKPHIITDDGSVITEPTAFSDFTEWFGIDEIGMHLSRFDRGEITMQELLREAMITEAQAPLNRIFQAASPFPKAILTLAGVKTFPDLFEAKFFAKPFSDKSAKAAVLDILGSDVKRFVEAGKGKRTWGEVLAYYLSGNAYRPMTLEELAEQIGRALQYATTTMGFARKGREAEADDLYARQAAAERALRAQEQEQQ